MKNVSFFELYYRIVHIDFFLPSVLTVSGVNWNGALDCAFSLDGALFGFSFDLDAPVPVGPTNGDDEEEENMIVNVLVH